MTTRRSFITGLLATTGLLQPATGARATAGGGSVNLVLLGDSVFDNASYVNRGAAVIDALRERLPPEQGATLLARDGAVIAGVLSQLQHLPANASHLFISAGGNDALGSSSVLTERASSVAEALGKIHAVRDRFAANYASMLDAASRSRLPITLCTIYDSQFADANQRKLANLALGVLNDVITRQAVARRMPVIDLRVLFNDPADYANAIEPSGQGSAKIADAMKRIVGSHDFTGPAVFYGSH
jgi:hypothetical protein